MPTTKAPTRDELFAQMGDPEKLKFNDQWNQLLNQPPFVEWVKENEGMKYLPIDKIELQLTALFQEWKPEIVNYGLILNSLAVHVRLHVMWPPTGLWTYRDGIGAVPVQQEKGTTNSFDASKIKKMAIQMNLPAAYSHALSNAAGKYGKIFGRDLNRQGTIGFDWSFGQDDNGELKGVKTEAVRQMVEAPEVVKQMVEAPIPVEPVVTKPIQKQEVKIVL